MWTFARGKILYSTNAVAWPGPGTAAAFGARYSTSTPAGAAPILAVVGPQSIAACTRGAHLTFRINGRPAAETSAVNTPPGRQRQLDLLLR